MVKGWGSTDSRGVWLRGGAQQIQGVCGVKGYVEIIKFKCITTVISLNLVTLVISMVGRSVEKGLARVVVHFKCSYNWALVCMFLQEP